MPEINSIPYESTDDLNKYLYDNFYSTEELEELTTGTGIVEPRIFEMLMSTGVTAGSICETYYNYNYFNPLYGEAVWKLRLNSMNNVKVFFGFKETLDEPIFPSEGDMVESHAGFMLDWQTIGGISGPHLYASVADGYSQHKVEITGIDMTHVVNYKIAYNNFSIMPLPYVEEQLGLPRVYSIERKWKDLGILGNYPPINEVHWIVHYIRNITNEEKNIKLNRFIYKEVYAD